MKRSPLVAPHNHTFSYLTIRPYAPRQYMQYGHYTLWVNLTTTRCHLWAGSRWVELLRDSTGHEAVMGQARKLRPDLKGMLK